MLDVLELGNMCGMLETVCIFMTSTEASIGHFGVKFGIKRKGVVV